MRNAIILGVGYLLFAIMIVLLIVSRKTQNATDKKGITIHKISKVFFWIIFVILSPVLIRVGITYALLIGVPLAIIGVAFSK